jgi:hypothetical protein
MNMSRLLSMLVLVSVVIFAGISLAAQSPLPTASVPKGLAALPSQYQPFFAGLAAGDPAVKTKMNQLMTILGAKLLTYLTSHVSESGPLGGEVTTGKIGLDGAVKEGPKMRALSMKGIDDFLASPYFKFLSAQCVTGSIHEATSKEKRALKKSSILGTDDGATYVVANEQLSIAYVFSNGYLAAIEIIQ